MINNLPNNQTEISTKQSEGIRIQATSFGLVALAVPSYYTQPNPDLLVPDPEEEKRCKDANLLQDMPVSVRDFLESLEVHMNKLFKAECKVRNILAGHEHGDDNGKAHFQCLVDMTCKSNFTPKPDEIRVGDVCILIIMQPCKNRKALEYYCKKENKFEWLKPVEYIYKKNKAGEDTDKVDAFGTIAMNREQMSKQEATSLILQCEPRTMFTSYNNVTSCLSNLVVPERDEFKWVWPEHMAKEQYGPIYTWFHRYCIDNPDRRKALCLFSEERGTGKTRFAKSLVNDDGYAVCYRNTFTGEPVGKDPKLLILDDMAFVHKDHTEMWKALVAGETTSIREAYQNWDWTWRVPCIITTNNKKFFLHLSNSPAFNTQIVFYEVTNYIGPDGTRPEYIDKVELHVSDALLGEIKANAALVSVKKADKKEINMEHFIENTQLRQKIADQSSLIQSLQKKIPSCKEKNFERIQKKRERSRDISQEKSREKSRENLE